MSLKKSLYYTDSFHLFQECGDDKCIYFQIHHTNMQVKLELALQEFLKIVKCIDLESLQKQANITDEQIESFVTKQVVERMNSENSIRQIFGFMIYGNANLEKEKQIENGMNHYKELRDNIRKLAKAVELPANKLYFGLETILDD